MRVKNSGKTNDFLPNSAYEERFRSLVESSGFGIATTDFRGRFTFVNEALCKMIGYSEKELIGKYFASFLHPEDKQGILKIFLNAWKYPHRKPSLEFRVVHKKGHVVHMFSTPTLYRCNGKIVGFNAIIADITERKRMEESLKKSEDRYRGIVELAPDAVVTVDMNGVITSVNATFSRISGYSKNEVIGKHFTELGALPTENTSEYLKLFDSTVIENPLPPTAFAYVCKDGTQRWGEAHISFVESDGKRTGLQGILRDITERKKTELAIRENQQKFERLFTGMPEAAVFWDSDFRVLDINPRFAELFGYLLDEIKGKSNLDVIVPKDRIEEANRLGRKAEQGYVGYDTVRKRKDGSLVHVSLSCAPIKVEGKLLGYVGMYKDNTERKKAEEKLQDSEERYRLLFEHSPIGIGIASHDGDVLDCNKAMQVVTGYSKDELRRIRLADAYEDPKQRKALLEAVNRDGAVSDFPVRLRRKDGTFYDALLNLSMVRIAGKNLLQMICQDVTERKKTEEALHRSEEKYRNLFENARDVILTTDLEGNVTSINNAIEKYGWKREEIVGKNMLELMAKESWPRLLKGIDQIAQGELLENEIELATPVGKRIAEYKSNPIVHDNKVIGVQVIARDITERREMEEKLRDSEEKFRAITLSANDAILMIDNEGHFSYWNPAAQRMFGYTEEEVKNKKMYELIAPERFHRNHISAFERFKKKGEGSIIGKTVQLPAIKKDGTEFPVEFSLSALQVKGKWYALGIFRDVTERKKMEEEIRQYSGHLEELVQKRTEELLESEKRYSVLVEEASDGVVIVQDGKIVFINRTGAEISHHSRDELLGLPFEQLVDEKYRQATREGYMLAIQGGTTPSTVEIEIVAKNGERVPVEGSVTRIQHQSRPAILSILRNIKERKRLEEQHLKLEKLATIGELATMVAHDLRNPLTSIRNAGYYLKKSGLFGTNAERKSSLEMLDIIEQETIYANNIINDLLDFAAKKPLHKKRQNIIKILEVTLAERRIPENIKVERNFRKAIAAVDEKQLNRVFLNITENAVQAMPNGGKLMITTKETKDYVEIMFEDTGVGISEENLGKIFQPLFTTKAKGIGLGLLICKRIVEQHSGTIDFKSKVSQGSAFTIRLPRNGGIGDK